MTILMCLGLYLLCSIVATWLAVTFMRAGPLADERMKGNCDE